MKLSELIIDRKIGLPIYNGIFPNSDSIKCWTLDKYTILVSSKQSFDDKNYFEVRFLDSIQNRYLSLNTVYELTEICSVLQIDLPHSMLYEKTFLRKQK